MYQKILNVLQDFFGISRKEARGALMMMVFCTILIWTPFVFRRWVLPFVPPSTHPPEMQVLDSIAALLEKQQALNYKSKRGPVSFDKTPMAPERIKLVDFDPNVATERELTGVGIPAFIAKRIERFRSKGGKFRRREDLLKIYDFPADLYARLERHIVITLETAGEIRKENVSKVNSHGFASKQTDNKRVFDINQCDTTALIRLKGIGSKLAQRILKFRDGLGGFHSTDQFAEVYGLDSLALSELRQYAKVNSPVKKININEATVAELSQHSYLKNRKLVQILINYRNEHGPFRSLEELRKVKAVDETTIQKIGPYLSF
ncbi:helix-hairpin-helix domain-containing protein [Dyadobacter sp. CY261]|uniref:helix-hairpin-helix domain-containing protein n=1 Tax=Dyadobacter sp. CY261 TaxID=2907203 RepID=UPI001F1FDD4A|nr:helix-hairpin-helix domain-containing protein [Dyadobacter sp. CY261]MCF0073325.1 helix-hairpin-helix domain-containing protein [Dyadobacter sp. CY261]